MAKLRPILLAAGGLALLAIAAISNAQHTGYDPALWSGLHYRMIGPERGGRVTAVTGVPSQPYTFYMGSTGGGVWKTVDAGHTWTNISDGWFSVASMGAIEVSLSNPDIVYAGTGSSKIRSNVSIGRGIYKSTDAGKTWTFAGLRDTGQISTIRVNPTNPDVVYVAALGNPFVPNKERGVYRSTDGGKTWKQILFLSDTLGAADLELQPANPKVIFACMWHGQRKPWTIVSGALEGGIYKSTDGGDNWSKLVGGLPHELFGRSNVAISAAKPERIYALIEAKPGSGLYRSEDSGATWTLVNGSGAIITRPFYYDTLGVDPNNPDVVFIGDEGWFKSTDGGKTVRRAQVPHGDNHDIWINPKNSDYMIQSNDGGANVSLDGGHTWSTQSNQPTAEIYQVAVDDQYPYLVYGAQQDNTTVIVPSLPLGTGQDFRVGPGCETGPIIPNPANPQVVYGSCKGQFSVQHMATTDEMRYWVGAESLYGNGGGTLIYRFQRVSPMEVSPFAPYAVYYGSQYLHRTLDGGVTWQKISPDLTAHPPGEPQEPSGTPITRDATGEEVYSTLYAIRESPVQKGLIWTGSNDGLVYVTRDGGGHWDNVTPKDLPPGGRVQNLEPSPHHAGTAYVAIYRYLLGDFAPYIYRTKDFGRSWTRLTDGSNGIAKDEPTRVVREDPAREGLLYAGTEFGMYISFDDGGHWQSFQLNLPVTPVTDIKVAHKDLVASTQGRSFWILDDLTPVEQLSDKVTTADAYLFAPREAVRTPPRGFGGGLGRGSGVQYPPAGAGIDYYLHSAPSGEIAMEVLDGAGKLVRKFTSAGAAVEERPQEADFAGGGDEEEGGGGGGGRGGRGGPTRLDKSAGMHRFTWDLRYPGPWQSATRPEGLNGPMAVPGKYAVRLTLGSWSATEPLTIIEDPRVTKAGVTTADLREQFEHNMRVRQLVSDANQTVAKLRAEQARLRAAAVPSGPGSAAAAELANLNDMAARLLTPPIRYSQPGLQTHITYLFGMTNSTDQKIGRDAIERYGVVRKSLDEITAELNKITK
ncbi:MAG: VPS10 domain-containing protein [Bryobacteraceae bacterium]